VEVAGGPSCTILLISLEVNRTYLIFRLVSQKVGKVDNPSEFSIDASHELALNLGIPLSHQPAIFCLAPSSQCASYPDNSVSCVST
jgi:hypothetical protein